MATSAVTYSATPAKTAGATAITSAASTLRGKSLCGLAGMQPVEVRGILDLAHRVKAHPERFQNALARRQMVLFFEKASLRTRLTFEVAMNTLGGNALFVDQTQSRLGERESLADVAHNIERWMDVCVLRTFAHETVTEMARHARIPVINALSEVEHPCQALADLQTLEEHIGPAAGRSVTFVGDANNVSTSLMLAAAHTGMHYTLASPAGYVPDAKLLAEAAPGALFMHCLPANRNSEVTDAVLDSPVSVVFDQAENRLHAQKAVLLMLLGSTHAAPAKARPFPVNPPATPAKKKEQL